MPSPAHIQSQFARLRAHLAEGRIPLWLKLAYTAFMAVLVPVYWINYGPSNFLYFCDIALFITLVGVWREDKLLVSMPAVGILAPQALWVADYAAHFAGLTITGMTDYMFNAESSRFLRGLSLFHGWLPFMLLFLVWRVGYDRRAFAAWTVLAWATLLVCYFLMPGPMPNPGNMPVNINYVHGLSDTAAQTWMHPLLWLTGLMVLMPIALFAPVHVLLSRWQRVGLPRQPQTPDALAA
ncbi:MAG: hypothetical protein ACKVP7_00215 [Hyphomicrobiaceae bacterium]